jgi:hypothetical protein
LPSVIATPTSGVSKTMATIVRILRSERLGLVSPFALGVSPTEGAVPTLEGNPCGIVVGQGGAPGGRYENVDGSMRLVEPHVGQKVDESGNVVPHREQFIAHYSPVMVLPYSSGSQSGQYRSAAR